MSDPCSFLSYIAPTLEIMEALSHSESEGYRSVSRGGETIMVRASPRLVHVKALSCRTPLFCHTFYRSHGYPRAPLGSDTLVLARLLNSLLSLVLLHRRRALGAAAALATFEKVELRIDVLCDDRVEVRPQVSQGLVVTH